jgi:hypothetical protein
LKLDHYYTVATAYFEALAKAFKPVRDLFAAADPSVITKAQRHDAGGHMLFRSIGLEIFTRTSVGLAKANGISVADAVHSASADADGHHEAAVPERPLGPGEEEDDRR